MEKITDAVRQLEADEGASPVLVAVVREFQAKLAKTPRHTTDGVPGRDSVMELEQAGDSAKVAAEADAALSIDARDSARRPPDPSHLQAEGWRLTARRA